MAKTQLEQAAASSSTAAAAGDRSRELAASSSAAAGENRPRDSAASSSSAAAAAGHRSSSSAAVAAAGHRSSSSAAAGIDRGCGPGSLLHHSEIFKRLKPSKYSLKGGTGYLWKFVVNAEFEFVSTGQIMINYGFSVLFCASV